MENSNNISKKGYVHIYSGNGKGKTTAAIGLAARALGSEMTVCYCSFHKDPELYGYSEMKSLEKLGAKIINFAKYHPHLEELVAEETNKEIANDVDKAIDYLALFITENKYDLIILDEVLISIRDKYLSEDKLVDFIKNKPVSVELVLTGRGITDKLSLHADYITNFECVKHPYYNNLSPRKGIEF